MLWNWLTQHLIAQGIPEGRVLKVLSLGFALGILIGHIAASPVLISVRPKTVTMAAAIAMALTTWLAITCGWIGLAVSSRLIGAIAGGDPKRLKKALLVSPAFFDHDDRAQSGNSGD